MVMCPPCLYANVPGMPTYSSANVPCCVLTCQCVLRAHVPYLLTWQRAFRAHMPTCFACFRAHVPTFFAWFFFSFNAIVVEVVHTVVKV